MQTKHTLFVAFVLLAVLVGHASASVKGGQQQLQAQAAPSKPDPRDEEVLKLLEKLNEKSATGLAMWKEFGNLVNEYDKVLSAFGSDVEDGAARFVGFMDSANQAFKVYQKDMKEFQKKAIFTLLKTGLKVLLAGIDISEPIKKAVELTAEAAFFCGENAGKIIKILAHPKKEEAKELLTEFFKTAAIVGVDEGIKAGLAKVIEEGVVAAIPGVGDVVDIYQLIKAAYKVKKSGDKFSSILRLWFKSNEKTFSPEVVDKLKDAKLKNELLKLYADQLASVADEQKALLKEIMDLRAAKKGF